MTEEENFGRYKNLRLGLISLAKTIQDLMYFTVGFFTLSHRRMGVPRHRPPTPTPTPKDSVYVCSTDVYVSLYSQDHNKSNHIERNENVVPQKSRTHHRHRHHHKSSQLSIM
jgi:hypothetical protein